MSGPLLVPVVAGAVVAPIDRTAANPPISFGGDAINNSGTGLYGNFAGVKVAVAGVDALTLSATGAALSASGTAQITADTNGVKFASNVYLLIGAGAPIDGTTGDNIAGPGSLYVNITAGVLYINTGLITAPTWVTVGSQT